MTELEQPADTPGGEVVTGPPVTFIVTRGPATGLYHSAPLPARIGREGGIGANWGDPHLAAGAAIITSDYRVTRAAPAGRGGRGRVGVRGRGRVAIGGGWGVRGWGVRGQGDRRWAGRVGAGWVGAAWRRFIRAHLPLTVGSNQVLIHTNFRPRADVGWAAVTGRGGGGGMRLMILWPMIFALAWVFRAGISQAGWFSPAGGIIAVAVAGGGGLGWWLWRATHPHLGGADLLLAAPAPRPAPASAQKHQPQGNSVRPVVRIGPGFNLRIEWGVTHVFGAHTGPAQARIAAAQVLIWAAKNGVDVQAWLGERAGPHPASRPGGEVTIGPPQAPHCLHLGTAGMGTCPRPTHTCLISGHAYRPGGDGPVRYLKKAWRSRFGTPGSAWWQEFLNRVAGQELTTDCDALALPTPPPNGLRIAIGRSQNGVVHLDFATHPHLLIAGTTGGGKSVLLETIVLALAALASPAGGGQGIELLLIDYKGGVAFQELAALPAVSAVLTDLDPGESARGLRALTAEIRRRERARAEAAGPPYPAPLFIVIDEFAQLHLTHPELMAELERIARQGRELDIHLILATQQATGCVSAPILANIGARIGLKLLAASEARDLLGPGAPTAVEPFPGRGVISLDGACERFQVARHTRTGAVVKAIAASYPQPLPAAARLWLPALPSRIETLADPTQWATVDDAPNRRQYRLAWGSGPVSPTLLDATARSEPSGQIDTALAQALAAVNFVAISGGPRSGRTHAAAAIARAVAAHCPRLVGGQADWRRLTVISDAPWPGAIPTDSPHIPTLLPHLGRPGQVIVIDGFGDLARAWAGRSGLLDAPARIVAPLVDATRRGATVIVTGTDLGPAHSHAQLAVYLTGLDLAQWMRAGIQAPERHWCDRPGRAIVTVGGRDLNVQIHATAPPALEPIAADPARLASPDCVAWAGPVRGYLRAGDYRAWIFLDQNCGRARALATAMAARCGLSAQQLGAGHPPDSGVWFGTPLGYAATRTALGPPPSGGADGAPGTELGTALGTEPGRELGIVLTGGSAPGLDAGLRAYCGTGMTSTPVLIVNDEVFALTLGKDLTEAV